MLCRDLFDRVGYEVEVNALFGDLQGQINRHDFAARYSKRPRPDIRGKNDLYNIWYDLFVMCGMLTLPCAS